MHERCFTPADTGAAPIPATLQRAPKVPRTPSASMICLLCRWECGSGGAASVTVRRGSRCNCPQSSIRTPPSHPPPTINYLAHDGLIDDDFDFSTITRCTLSLRGREAADSREHSPVPPRHRRNPTAPIHSPLGQCPPAASSNLPSVRLAAATSTKHRQHVVGALQTPYGSRGK